MAWHPRDNAYPVVWQLRNGRWGEVYALVRQVPVEGRMTSMVAFELVESDRVVGTYEQGDDAAVVGFVRYVERSARAGAQSVTVDPAEARARLETPKAPGSPK